MLTLTDLFCGAGGSSTGAVEVPGVAFGGFLRLDGDPLTQAQIEERDRGVRAAYAIQREVMAGG